MESNWNILTKELSINGIELVDQSHCVCSIDGQDTKIPLKKKVVLLQKNIRTNTAMLADLFGEVLELLQQSTLEEPVTVGVLETRLFVSSLQGLAKFARFILDEMAPCIGTASVNAICRQIRSALNRDISTFPKDVILSLPSYRLAISWLHRVVSKLFYMCKLLKFAGRGSKEVEKASIKLARGVQGPWSNLDLPLKERAFEWDDIEDEVRGRDRDIKRQRRYKKGLENYNNDGRVGEGYYWRELRNEPYSWTDRDSESPYPGRNVLTRW